MPIAPELRHFYGRTWRLETRPRILARAKNCCENCGVKNYEEVTRAGGWWLWIRLTFGIDTPALLWFDETGAARMEQPPPGRRRTVRIVLTIAHLNHTAGDDRDENLKALCQWCHLHYDKEHHHQTRADRKDRSRPLLEAATQ